MQKRSTLPDRQVFVSEAIIRPTGLLDPEIIVRPTVNQVDDILEEVRKRRQKKQRVLITTLTKKFAEELDSYFKELSIKSTYLHSDIDTLERIDILKNLREGVYEVLIGINLLREGLDLPEVSLVAIFDADKEGFLRSKTSLIQIIGRAARHQEGQVIMYADRITQAMRIAIEETKNRRDQQIAYNSKYGVTPVSAFTTRKTLKDRLAKEKSKNSEFGLAKAFLGSQGLLIKKDQEKSEKHKNFNYLDEVTLTNYFSVKQKPDKNKQKISKFSRFQDLTEFYLKEIKKLKLSFEELQKKQKAAISEKNFEQAAAIQELLENYNKK